jgi:hypothetical protein
VNQHHNEFGNTSRDIGAWVASDTDVTGVDEASLCMKAMGMMYELSVDYVHQRAAFLDQEHAFDDYETAYPTVLGGSVEDTSRGHADFHDARLFDDDRLIPPPVLE